MDYSVLFYKEIACSAGDLGSLPELGRSPGEGNGPVTPKAPACAAAAKSLQSCPTLCDPIDGSPTRLLCPWESSGKNIGVGCHFLLQCMKVKSESEVAQSCPTPSDPMDCSPPGSSVHGIFQARVLEWGAIAVSLLVHASLCAQSCPTLCRGMDCNLPGSSVHGIFQSRVLEWVAVLSSRGFSRPRDGTHISYIYTGRWVLYQKHHLGSQV